MAQDEQEQQYNHHPDADEQQAPEPQEKHEEPNDDSEADEQQPQNETAEDKEEPTPQPVITSQHVNTGKKNWLHFFKTKWGIALLVVVGVLLIGGLLTAIPVTRYGILGNFIHKDTTVSVVDSKTGKPVTAADVSLPGATAQTDKNGSVTLRNVPVGQYTLTIKKRYYKDASQSVTVPILSAASFGQVKLEATGRQVPVTITNKISGQPLAKVTISVLGTSAITDDQGKATIVVPANTTTVKATLKADGYNDNSVDVAVVEQIDPKNSFTLTPAGKVYFLSNRTGTINVMSANLDGSGTQVAVQGTGKEDIYNTLFVASRDWKYAALIARRTDDPNPQLYLLDTSNNKLSLVDQGNVDISVVGWSKQNFVYVVTRHDILSSQPKHQALKSFNAATSKISTLDESDGATTPYGDITENITSYNTYLTDDGVDYFKIWQSNNYYALQNRKTALYSIGLDGANKRTIKEFALGQGSFTLGARLNAPNQIYFTTNLYVYSLPPQTTTGYFKYQAGENVADITSDEFNRPGHTSIASPSGQKTFWNEQRDGKSSLIIGDANAAQGKEIAAMTDFSAYGWYSDSYVLVSKDRGQLYILPDLTTDASKAVKIADYYNGYGYGSY